MSKIIIIGESRLEITLSANGSTGTSHPAGLLFNAACRAAAKSQVIFLSEIGADTAGDILVKHLNDSGVDASLIDRQASPATPVTVSGATGAAVTYRLPGDDEGLDVVWPKIERGDMVVFGGYFAIDPRIRQRLWQLLEAAVELKASIVYIPDIVDPRVRRVTHIMPQVFENLEIANAVIVTPADLQLLFSTSDPDKAFKNHISFYCDAMASVNPDGSVDTFGDITATPATSPEATISTILTNI